MKINNILRYFALLTFWMLIQNSFAQTYTLGELTVCGTNNLTINIDNAIANRANYVYVNGVYQPTATMPSVVRFQNVLKSAIVLPSNLFKIGVNTISITGGLSKQAYKVPNNVVSVDGFLDETNWTLNNMVFGIMDVNNPIPNGGNSSVNFGLLWDDTNLYIGVKVIDTTMFGSGDKDKLEIYIDPYEIDDSYSSASTIQNEAAMQLIIDYDAMDESNLRFWNNAGNRTTAGITLKTRTITGMGYKLPSTGPVANRRPVLHSGTGWVLEMAIPWTRFYNTTTGVGSAGVSFGFDVAYNDNQKRLPNGRNEQLFWNSDNLGSNNRWYTTENFGDIALSANARPIEIPITVFTVLGIKPDLTGSIPTITGTCATSVSIEVPTFAGFTTFWQSMSNEESELDPVISAKVFSAPITTNGIYYNIKSEGGCWTETSFIEILPSNLTSITGTIIYPACGLANISATGVSIPNTNFYWQSSLLGTNTSLNINSNSVYTIAGPGIFKTNIRAFNTITGCWSQLNKLFETDLSGTKPSNPNATLLSTVSSACVGKTGLVYYTNTVPGNTIWYWQTEPLGTLTGFANDSLEVTTSGVKYLRANLFGCWSNASLGITVDVSDVIIPAPITKNYTYFQNDATTVLELTSINTLYGINWYIDTQTATPVQIAPTPTSIDIGTKNFFASYTKENCESSKSPIVVEIKELIILKPSTYYGITPNGSGPSENEKFEIPNINRVLGNKVIITDKWGNIVFEKENYDNSFEGKIIMAKICHLVATHTS